MTEPILIRPYCGADGPRRCDFDDNAENDDGEDRFCPWEESGQYADAKEEYDEAMAEEEDEDD